MSTTVKNDLFVPEVCRPVIDAKLNAMLKLAPYVHVDESLVGKPGDKIVVPMWGYIGDAVSMAENTELEYTPMSATTTAYTVGKAGKGISITTEALEAGADSRDAIVAQANKQLAMAIASKCEEDEMAAAVSGSVVYDGTAGIIGYNGIVDAVGMFLDESDKGTEKVMFIHPGQETQLRKDTNFTSADKFTAGVAVSGAIGEIAGCWVKKSRRVPKVDAISAVTGVYTVTIGGTVASGDKITIAGVETTLDGTSGASASAAVTAIKAKSFTNYTVTGSGAVLTFTEASGKEGTGAPTCSSTNTATTLTVATTTAGVAAEVAKYVNPIIKYSIDDSETEYTEGELPAITLFLKKDTTFSSFYNQTYDRYENAAYRYYGVAKTNDAKLVVAKFAQTAAS